MQIFFIGFIIGFSVLGIFSYTNPLLLTGVQQELVKQGHGFYNPLTREFVLKECR